ncbi:MAG: iron ABC transporter permease [Variovorax sp.]
MAVAQAPLASTPLRAGHSGRSGRSSAVSGPDRQAIVTATIALLALALLPWYAVQDGFWSIGWLLAGYPFATDSAPALFLWLKGANLWLLPIGLVALAALGVSWSRPVPMRFGAALVFLGILGMGYMLTQGFVFGLRGWNFAWLNTWLGKSASRQFGMGYGALVVGVCFLFLLTRGLALRGRVAGDSFVAGSLGLIIALTLLFIGLPVVQMLIIPFKAADGAWSLAPFAERLFDAKIWRLDCLTGGVTCGVAWNSLALAVAVGVISTLLGLAFALVLTRTNLRFRAAFKSLSLLPIITPPFVIGLALILMFGLSGNVTQFVAAQLGVEPTRWIYGFRGVLIAQVLSFTPICFLVLIGVVEAISPSLEEAAQTLRAGAWETFRSVTWPLMRPGLANAFLLGFIESMADFGNPLVLGGNFNVLSTDIFFSVVGSQNDQGRAAVLAMVLLLFTVGAFVLQQRWLGRRSYTSIGGKGDGGVHPPLPRRIAWPIVGMTALWGVFTIVIYAMIVYGSFVELWGRDNTLTLKHYLRAFAVATDKFGVRWDGSAWNSFWTTLQIAIISAPLTAAVGLIAAWLLTRQEFGGKKLFEFGTMLSFAIPGTVIGVSYIIAFNVPPIELTGTAAILVICFVFRNMPVGVRSGIASLSQIDKSLDEASLSLGASSATTFRRITLPLIRPAILSALVYSFVRTMTAISAVIFLVSARHDMATSYIIGRVENNEYGVAIAYSTVLILVMLVAIGIFQWLVGQRRLGRRGGAVAAAAAVAPIGPAIAPAGA